MPKRDARLLAFAKQMRSEPTPAEARLWSALRAGRLDGIKFVHQSPAAGAIPDFVARRHKLVIEVDGDTHDLTAARDAARAVRLKAQGYRILRFTNEDVMRNLDGVLHMIREAVRTASLPPRFARHPLPNGEREDRVSGEGEGR